VRIITWGVIDIKKGVKLTVIVLANNIFIPNVEFNNVSVFGVGIHPTEFEN